MKSPYRLNRRSRKRVQMAVKQNNLPPTKRRVPPLTNSEWAYYDMLDSREQFVVDIFGALTDVAQEMTDGKDADDQ
jgi:hypothetical protein